MNFKHLHGTAILGYRRVPARPESFLPAEQLVAEAIADFENPPAPEEKKPETDEPLVRGEKLSALRERAHKWGGWESWK
jgi:hypothetical protein